MDEKCAICGATENIQKHHVSYEPEIIQFLWVNCHKAVHNHGVGKAPGWNTLFEALKNDAETLFKEGATNKEVAKACDISYATASHWRSKLGLEVKESPNWGTKGNRLLRIERKLKRLERELKETEKVHEAIGKEIERREKESEI